MREKCFSSQPRVRLVTRVASHQFSGDAEGYGFGNSHISELELPKILTTAPCVTSTSPLSKPDSTYSFLRLVFSISLAFLSCYIYCSCLDFFFSSQFTPCYFFLVFCEHFFNVHLGYSHLVDNDHDRIMITRDQPMCDDRSVQWPPRERKQLHLTHDSVTCPCGSTAWWQAYLFFTPHKLKPTTSCFCQEIAVRATDTIHLSHVVRMTLCHLYFGVTGVGSIVNVMVLSHKILFLIPSIAYLNHQIPLAPL